MTEVKVFQLLKSEHEEFFFVEVEEILSEPSDKEQEDVREITIKQGEVLKILNLL